MRCMGPLLRSIALASLACAACAGVADAASPQRDAWADVVAEEASRDEVIAALGKPEIEFTAFVKRGERPLKISPSLPPPPMPGEPPGLANTTLLRVLEYPGARRGLAYQVVLRDGKVWYCIAPPLADEADTAAVERKHGKAEPAPLDVLVADLLRTWEILAYPKANRLFVREPGAQPIAARMILGR